MLDNAKLRDMLVLQFDMNSVVNPNWMGAGYDWCRAAAVECAELMDHYGWKWWKKQETDLAQAQIELVDIWHFGLSHNLLLGGTVSDAAEIIMNDLSSEYLRNGIVFDKRVYHYDDMDFRAKLDVFMGLLCGKRFNAPLFERLMQDLDLSWDRLYMMYVGKNILNTFRQANGYKEGTYIKIWRGQEDNVWLEEIMSKLTAPEDIRQELQRRYNQVKASQAQAA